jgi:RNA polymerase sigma-70 factor, ECF subfamily
MRSDNMVGLVTTRGYRRLDNGGWTDDLAALSERYRDRLVVHAARVLRDPSEAEDVAQEVLVKAGAGSTARPDEENSLRAWLYAACRNLAIDRLRARGRRKQAHVRRPQPANAAAAVEAAAERVTRLDDAEQVRAALGRLEDPYGTALRLRYIEGCSFTEVAERMGALERTARTWVGRGLVKLRQRLGGAQ